MSHTSFLLDLAEFFFFNFIIIYSFIWVPQVLVVALRIFSCDMWDLAPSDQTGDPCVGSAES